MEVGEKVDAEVSLDRSWRQGEQQLAIYDARVVYQDCRGTELELFSISESCIHTI